MKLQCNAPALLFLGVEKPVRKSSAFGDLAVERYIGFRKLGSTLFHSFFQFVMRFLQRFLDKYPFGNINKSQCHLIRLGVECGNKKIFIKSPMIVFNLNRNAG